MIDLNEAADQLDREWPVQLMVFFEGRWQFARARRAEGGAIEGLGIGALTPRRPRRDTPNQT